MMIMKLEMFFLTFQKHLIKSGTMVLYSNYKKMEYRVTYEKFSNIFWQIEDKGLN